MKKVSKYSINCTQCQSLNHLVLTGDEASFQCWNCDCPQWIVNQTIPMDFVDIAMSKFAFVGEIGE